MTPPPAAAPADPVEPAPAEATAAIPIPGALPGDAVRAFQASVRRPDRAAEVHDSRASKGLVLYVINSTTCPFCLDYVARLKELEAKYLPRGVDVIHVYPNRGESDAEKVGWHQKQGFRGGQILDAGATITKLLEAEKTPTVYVVDARHVIVYRGGIDDSSDGLAVTTRPLEGAVDATLAGKPVEVSSFEQPG